MSAPLTTREAFLESVLHDEHEILGRKMLPFCFEMWCVLDALESPLTHGGAISMADLQTAVVACSTPSVSEFYRLTRKPSLSHQCWKIISRGSASETLAKFNQYIEDYIPMFPRWNHTEGSYTQELKSPEIFLIAARLIDRGHSKKEIYREWSVGELIAWKLSMDEAKGDPLDGIMSDSTRKQMEEAGML